MLKFTKYFLVLMLSFLLLAAFVGCMTMFNKKIPTHFSAAPTQDHAIGETLKVLVWNVGYAGLGEESDFVADGGEMLQPPSKTIVQKNLAGITDTLGEMEFDVALMQEVAAPGFLSRGENVLKAISDTLSGYGVFFSSGMNTKGFPKPISLKHGLATFSKKMETAPKVIRINNEPGYIMGFIKRKYHIQELEIPHGENKIVLMNIHLSAFDDNASVRREQLNAVLDIADQHYQQGKAVVIGGDWNMRLTQTDFPHTSSEDALFWIHDFTEEALKPGWKRAFDTEHPTVRTNERPFIKGENYTTIIDGLVVSPNVNVKSAKVRNLDFKYTDHQPAIFEIEVLQN